uniref:Adhesion G protein-coupled receptor L4 n=1 Tax=Capra hircus TaxID=9925 RepID=A0A8C2P6E5_CAPHI
EKKKPLIVYSLLSLVGFSTLLNCCYTQNCTKTPCHPNAKCEIRNGAEGCYCNTGYSGNGVTICEDDNECGNLTQSCGENANCTNTQGSYYCMCAPGFRSSSNEDKFITNDGTTCIEIVNPDCHLDNACIAENINKTLTKIRHIEEPVALLREVYRNSLKDLSPMDIITYTEVLAESSPLFINSTNSAKDTSSNSTLTEFVKTLNNFVQKDTFTVWDKLSTNQRRTHLTKLIHTAEQATLRISQNFRKTTQFDTNSSDIALKAFFFDSHHIKYIHPHMNMDGDNIKIFPKRKTAYDSNGRTLTNPSHKMSLFQTTDKYKSQCAFWNYLPDTMNGSWSSEGCELTYSNDTHTSCRCNHLTHFAILMSSGSSIGIKDYNILTRITQLGIIISLICLALCIFTFWFFSEIQSTRTTIHKNLCCSLFLAELVFLVGINTNTNKVCRSLLLCYENYLLKLFSQVNLLAFGVIIYKVFRHTAGLKPEVSCYENIRSCARGALALLFLLGTTWIFGVLHVVHASVVTAYLFTVSNAFQGMFIFLFLCILSRKIQEEYYRLFKNVPCCFGCLR